MELAMLEKELGAYGACDPVKVDEKKRGGVLAHEAAIRWTGEMLWCIYAVLPADDFVDNYAMLLSHFTRQHGVDPGDIRTALGIHDDYEDIC
jgi:hypothetical protein